MAEPTAVVRGVGWGRVWFCESGVGRCCFDETGVSGGDNVA